MIDSILPYAPLISATIVSGVLTIALINFSSMRKNTDRQKQQEMKTLMVQTEQQIYARIMEMRLNLENTEAFTKIAMESPIFAERFKVVETPSEYYIIVAFFDLFEDIFHLHKNTVLDDFVWKRWKVIMSTMMTIPRFQKVWEITRSSHPDEEFRNFLDSLNKDKVVN